MTTLKPLNAQDVTNTRTLLHEAIPLTGTIVSGTYGVENIKNYSHGMFQSVFDYPYLSSSSNHIFDITVGVSTTAAIYPTITSVEGQQSKKKNIYNQMSQVLVGYDVTGSIERFDEDGDIVGGGEKITSAFILPFSRLLVKDEIKKETFSMTLGVSASYDSPFGKTIEICDVSASTEYRVNSPAGEYGILYAKPKSNEITTSNHKVSIGGVDHWYAGLIYYQAGIVVLTASIFQVGDLLNGVNIGYDAANPVLQFMQSTASVDMTITGSQISASADAFRNRVQNIQFNNTTELNSTVYFCRANHNEFNYSSNPTYLEDSKIRVKNESKDDPVSYITSIGLYNDMNELLAVAKLSEPLKKTPSNEFTLRVRLDY